MAPEKSEGWACLHGLEGKAGHRAPGEWITVMVLSYRKTVGQWEMRWRGEVPEFPYDSAASVDE